MMAEINNMLLIAVIGIFGTIIGVIYWVIKSRDKLVYKDVCESERHRLEDCIEAQEKLSQERFDALTEKVDTGFREIKQELIKIRNNQK